MKQLLVACLVMMALGGCTRTVYVDRNTVTYIGMDETWLTSCPVVPPPNKAVYNASTDLQKRDMWSAVYTEQMKVTAKRNDVMDQAREYNRKKLASTTVLCDNKPCQQ